MQSERLRDFSITLAFFRDCTTGAGPTTRNCAPDTSAYPPMGYPTHLGVLLAFVASRNTIAGLLTWAHVAQGVRAHVRAPYFALGHVCPKLLNARCVAKLPVACNFWCATLGRSAEKVLQSRILRLNTRKLRPKLIKIQQLSFSWNRKSY